MRASRLMSIAASAALLVALAGCAQSSDPSGEGGTAASAGSSGAFPVTIDHAFGETTIQAKPKRVATVSWANHEVPLALGVVPVGMSKATWGDDDGNGVLPWVEDRLTQLGAKTPVLFDETDGIDFESVADTRPDVILADIQLADNSSGIDAVNDLLRDLGNRPVIFITAFPERLLTGDKPEPAFLISKPYTVDQVVSAVSQAMFFSSTETLHS